ncbi:hypothetical protein TWF730_008090 [Orbilia blumenaviensis]|uniref:Uncharacterized protein n=1 Tax=Orbilia blumenaviensis TaxID=1796055 RepID=A0AAV9V9V1_9PEZI
MAGEELVGFHAQPKSNPDRICTHEEILFERQLALERLSNYYGLTSFGIPSKTPSQSEVDDDNSFSGSSSSQTITSGLSIKSDQDGDDGDKEEDYGSEKGGDKDGTEDGDYDEDIEDPGSIPIPTVCIAITDDFDCTVVTSCERNVVKFQVSEKILSLSSIVLKKILQDAKLAALSISSDGEEWEEEEEGEEEDDEEEEAEDDEEDDEDDDEDSGLSEVYESGSGDLIRLEGDPHALEVIFQIIHYQGDDKILEDLDFDCFAHVAFLCEKYKWQKALRGWIQYWLDKHEPRALEPGHENWLYIATVFNTQRHAAELTKLLADVCGIFPVGRSGHGKYLSRENKTIDAQLWPSETFCK